MVALVVVSMGMRMNRSRKSRMTECIWLSVVPQVKLEKAQVRTWLRKLEPKRTELLTIWAAVAIRAIGAIWALKSYSTDPEI